MTLQEVVKNVLKNNTNNGTCSSFLEIEKQIYCQALRANTEGKFDFDEQIKILQIAATSILNDLID